MRRSADCPDEAVGWLAMLTNSRWFKNTFVPLIAEYLMDMKPG